MNKPPIKQKRLFVIAMDREQFNTFCLANPGREEVIQLTNSKLLRAWTGLRAEYVQLPGTDLAPFEEALERNLIRQTKLQ